MIDDLLDHIVKGVRKALDEGHYDPTGPAVPGPRPSLCEAVIAAGPDAFLAELKPRSPSGGTLMPGPDDVALERAGIYRDHDVTGISVLTERERFGGSPALLARIASLPDAPPVLWKDFVVSDRQLASAAHHGASAVLLIDHLFRRGLTDDDVPAVVDAAHARGLEVLYEVDDATAFDHALGLGVDMVGINNRDLRTLEMDKDRTAAILRFRLDRLGGTPVLGLSGVEERDDVLDMTRGGASGVLVGTTLMRAPDPGATIRHLRGTVHVKCCGAGHPDDEAVADLGRADAVGVVVDANGAARERSVAEARHLFSSLPQHVERVVVTTVDDPARAASLVAATGATSLQWHVDGGPDALAALREHLDDDTRLIALVRPDDDAPVRAQAYAQHADRLLIDAPVGTDGAGGSGTTTDWRAARNIVRIVRPFPVVLAGGLTPDNVRDAILQVRPWGVDTSSGIESVKGRKDPDRVLAFIHACRNTFGVHDPKTPPRLPVIG